MIGCTRAPSPFSVCTPNQKAGELPGFFGAVVAAELETEATAGGERRGSGRERVRAGGGGDAPSGTTIVAESFVMIWVGWALREVSGSKGVSTAGRERQAAGPLPWLARPLGLLRDHRGRT